MFILCPWLFSALFHDAGFLSRPELICIQGCLLPLLVLPKLQPSWPKPSLSILLLWLSEFMTAMHLQIHIFGVCSYSPPPPHTFSLPLSSACRATCASICVNAHQSRVIDSNTSLGQNAPKSVASIWKGPWEQAWEACENLDTTCPVKRIHLHSFLFPRTEPVKQNTCAWWI